MYKIFFFFTFFIFYFCKSLKKNITHPHLKNNSVYSYIYLWLKYFSNKFEALFMTIYTLFGLLDIFRFTPLTDWVDYSCWFKQFKVIHCQLMSENKRLKTQTRRYEFNIIYIWRGFNINDYAPKLMLICKQKKKYLGIS